MTPLRVLVGLVCTLSVCAMIGYFGYLIVAEIRLRIRRAIWRNEGPSR